MEPFAAFVGESWAREAVRTQAGHAAVSGGSSSSSSSAAQGRDANELRHASQLREHGLENENGSNHCFLNVVIQALWNLKSFRRRLLSSPLPHNDCSGSDGEKSQGLHGDLGGKLAPESCYAALKHVFSEFIASEADTLPPDVLRLALSRVYDSENRFQLGEMEDATETIEALLGILHACNVQPGKREEPQASPVDSDQLGSRRLSHSERVEHASDFGCHPLCLAHEVFGMEVVDLPRCTFCGATGEPSVSGQYLYCAYVSELLECQKRLYEAENASNPFGLVQDAVSRMTSRLGGTSCCSLQDALRELCQSEEGEKCGECNSRRTFVMERWMTRRPKTFIISLAWPSSSPGRETLWLVLSMIRPKLQLEQIFRFSHSGPPGNEVQSEQSYSFHGLICYYGMHYIALFWCPARKRWVLFDDTFVREKEDWSAVASLIVSGQYVPTLIFYQCLQDTSAPAESLEELVRQVTELEDRQSACALM
eukprot:TRINITY_DN73377_c0_g1_i1.p1 TRINITY_DN73377_c0_g1~~TRINITY_DN73377_c0_g1_i1.p1  ORF type:complete len:482 (-),score=81.79 TRINITY_DN73377_c0_g1_i1:15-1460(-)